MELLLPSQHNILEQNFENPHNFRFCNGGHMAYKRVLFEDFKNDTYFVKAYDPNLLKKEWRRKEMLYFIDKEARVYNHLQQYGYEHVPILEYHEEGLLVLSGLTKQQGWHWRAPLKPNMQIQYKNDVLAAFEKLETIPIPPTNQNDEISIDTFYNYGWDKLHDTNIPNLITKNLKRWNDSLYKETPESALKFSKVYELLAVKRVDMQKDTFNHHDARQSNIAWHQEFGARIVDWSWAESGLPYGDATMFLLDIHKADHDVSDKLSYLNPIYAKMMIGYWLQRSQTEHMEGNDNVRMQQFISAIKASELLLNYLEL
jgi:hypothetical protein